MTDSTFPCPKCGGHLSAEARGRWVLAVQGHERRRSCRQCHTVVETIERHVPSEFLKFAIVRSARGRTVRYDTDRLQADVSLKLRPVLSKSTRNLVVDRAEELLLRNWHARKKVKLDRLYEAGEIASAVTDALKELSQERRQSKLTADALRRAHIMYALSQERLEFQDDRPAVSLRRDSFEVLPDVLEWLSDQYPGVRSQAQAAPKTPHYVQPRTDSWHLLRRDEIPTPTRLIRRLITQRETLLKLEPGEGEEDRTLRSLSEKEEEWEEFPFDYGTYMHSLERVFSGRDNHSHFAHCTSQWVLYALAGQATVRVSDLVALTTQCLRRVDALAAIRWAIISKRLQPAGLVEEIRGLIEWPAPRLVFEAEAAPDPRHSGQIQPLGGVRNVAFGINTARQADS